MIKQAKRKLYRLLRKSQKYTKTDMVYLAKGGFWLNLGQGIASLTGLGLAVAFANLLPPETYGTFKFILSFIPILTIPCLKGMNQALVRAISQGNEGTLYPALKTKMKWGALGTIGAVIVASYYFYNDNSLLGFSFLMMAVFIPFIQNLNIWLQYLNGKRNFKALSQYKSIMRILVVSIMVTTIFFTHNLFLILFAHFAANTLIRGIFFLWTVRKYPPNNQHHPPTIGYGKHLSLMGILGPISQEMDKVLIFHFLGPVQVAVYTFSLRPIQELKKPLQNLNKLALPKLSNRDMSALKRSLPGKMTKIFFFLLPITVIYIFIAPYFYQLLFPQYIEATIYSQVFALSLLLFPKVLMSQTLLAHAQTKQLYILRISTPALKIILLAVLLPLHGLWGAIIALLVTEIFNLTLLLSLFHFHRVKTQ